MSIARALLVLGVVILTGCSQSTPATPTEIPATPTPEYDLVQLVEDFHAALMEDDLTNAMSYFHEDAVFSQQWTDDSGDVETADYDSLIIIESMLRDTVVNVSEISILDAEVDGNRVTFTVDSTWVDLGRFHNEAYAEFQDGKIIHLFWNYDGEQIE